MVISEGNVKSTLQAAAVAGLAGKNIRFFDCDCYYGGRNFILPENGFCILYIRKNAARKTRNPANAKNLKEIQE